MTLSQTPDITFEKMMKIGPVSGVAMKMMFLDAHMAVARKEETFGKGLQRRLNIIKAAIGAVIDTSLAAEAKAVQLVPKITPFLPQNVTEEIENLTVAKTGGIISTETAIEQNPLITDSETEIERMQNDRTSELTGTEENTPSQTYSFKQ
jgi:SPP1 family phage portal protein